MISIHKNIDSKERLENKTIYMTVELRGLSSDTKPTQIDNKFIDNGSTFIEMDTGTVFLYDLENKNWEEI